MRLAVFFYADAAIIEEDITWLHHLLKAMLQHEHHSLLIFTNNKSLSSLAHPRIVFPSWSQPAGFYIHRRTLRRWQRAATAAGAERTLFIGSQSFRAGALPAYLLLQPSRSTNAKALQAVKTKTTHVWVTNNAAKKILESQGIRNTVVLHGGPMYAPADGSLEAEVFKEQHTEGCAYFLYAGSMASTPPLIGLLKAFSKFKHRQKSSWKLVLLPLGADPVKVAAFKDLLSSYKYRHDVVLPECAEAQSKAASFFGAAYAFIQPLPVQPYGNFLHDAIRAALPVIATSEPLHKEVAGNAALYYEAGDEQLLASCLMQVYKDEALQSRLAETARQAAAQWGWEQTAAVAWQSLASAEK